MVKNIHKNKVDGVWIQGVCGTTLEEATKRLQGYADSGKGLAYALIEGYNAYLSPGHVFTNFEALCPVAWDKNYPMQLTN